MKFSVIVPVYNVEKYIKDCIDSILNQSYDNFELIIVNDVTTDNKVVVSAAIVKIKSNSSKAKDYMVEDPFEKAAILKQAGFTYSKLRNVNIYVEEVM